MTWYDVSCHFLSDKDINKPLRRNVYAVSRNRLVCLESQANCCHVNIRSLELFAMETYL